MSCKRPTSFGSSANVEHGRAKLRALLPRLTHDSICVGDAGAVGVDRPDNFKTNTQTHLLVHYYTCTLLSPWLQLRGWIDVFALLCVLCDSFEARGLSRKLSDDSFTKFYVYRRCATHSICFCVLLAKDMIVRYEVIASLEWTLFSGRMKERIKKFLDDLHHRS